MMSPRFLPWEVLSVCTFTRATNFGEEFEGNQCYLRELSMLPSPKLSWLPFGRKRLLFHKRRLLCNLQCRQHDWFLSEILSGARESVPSRVGRTGKNPIVIEGQDRRD